MALHWDISKVKDHHLLHNTKDANGNLPFPEGSDEDMEGDAEWAITERIIWLTIGIGMNQITEKNWEDFYRRVQMWQQCKGAVMRKGNEPFYLTPDHIYRRIGLYTNATTIPITKFMRRCYDDIRVPLMNPTSY